MNRRTKIGLYTLVMASVVLAVIIVINLLTLNAPTKYTKLDMTSLSLYTLSDTTAEAVEKITEEVNIYFLCSGGEDGSGSAVNNLPMLSVFLGRYAELNDNIKLNTVDPIANPTFTDKYEPDGLENYSIIVESAKRFKIVDFADLYYYYNESTGKISPDMYQTYMMYAQMGYFGNNIPVLTLNFDGESAITSALDYVTTDKIPTAYILEGHGETALSETLLTSIENDNMQTANLSLLTAAIPEDAGCIIINAPTTDINTDEAKALSEYLAGGGKMVVTTVYTSLGLPNLMGVLAEFGLSPVDGMIVEGDANRFANNTPYYLLPNVSTTSSLTAPLASSSAYMFMAFSHGITNAEKEDLTVTPLFSTSSSAYTIPASAETTAKTEDSSIGPFDIGILAENGEGGKLIWLGSPAFSDSMNQMTGANYQYFISMLGGIVERDRIVYNIPANEVAASRLVVNELQASLWSAVLIVILPLAFAVCGVIYWYVRRRK